MAERKSAAEVAEERTEALQKQYSESFEAHQKAAEEAREEEPSVVESEEEYYERVRNVPGIFGDTDTTAGVGATGTDVPSARNEQATVAVAQADVDAESGDEDAQGASHAEARRQADTAADAVPSAEQVDEAADNNDDNDDNDSVKSPKDVSDDKKSKSARNSK